jgi:hypothetical protein
MEADELSRKTTICAAINDPWYFSGLVVLEGASFFTNICPSQSQRVDGTFGEQGR